MLIVIVLEPKRGEMKNKSWEFIRYLLTDRNDNWDLSILLWLVAVGVYLWKASQVPAQTFDFLNFGAGCVGVFGAGKALEWLTERHAKDKI